MDKQEIKAFFDQYAPRWDGEMIKHQKVVDEILDLADIRAGLSVLDVACGTGVLIPDYLSRQVGKVTGVDLSSEMLRIAGEKFPQPCVEFIQGDMETIKLKQQYDRGVVYNAFPHFPDPEALIRSLAEALVPGGRLTIAHGMSREMINRHHEGAAKKVSAGLMEEHQLAAIMEPWFKVDVVCSDHEKYIVSGCRK